MLEFITISSSYEHFEAVFKLLSQLTTLGKGTYEDYVEYIMNFNNNKYTYLMKDNDTIVGIGTLLIEKKVIHGFKSVGHIEDIVVDTNYRGRKYGKHLIHYLLDMARSKYCFKVILDCSSENQGFYEACGFSNKGVCMGYYFE